MSPSDPLVRSVNTALSDPDVRASIRQMHAAGYPLIKMVEDLGLEDGMTSQIRQILEDLPTDVVEAIRQATLQMLNSSEYKMPLNCMVDPRDLETGVPVRVDVAPIEGRPTIQIRPMSDSTTSS